KPAALHPSETSSGPVGSSAPSGRPPAHHGLSRSASPAPGEWSADRTGPACCPLHRCCPAWIGFANSNSCCRSRLLQTRAPYLRAQEQWPPQWSCISCVSPDGSSDKGGQRRAVCADHAALCSRPCLSL